MVDAERKKEGYLMNSTVAVVLVYCLGAAARVHLARWDRLCSCRRDGLERALMQYEHEVDDLRKLNNIPLEIIRPRILVLLVETEWTDITWRVVYKTVSHHLVLTLEPFAAYRSWTVLYRTEMRPVLGVHIGVGAGVLVRKISKGDGERHTLRGIGSETAGRCIPDGGTCSYLGARSHWEIESSRKMYGLLARHQPALWGWDNRQLGFSPLWGTDRTERLHSGGAPSGRMSAKT